MGGCLQVIYPQNVGEAAAAMDNGDAAAGQKALDDHLLSLMQTVRLEYLLDREGGWKAVSEWGETLSLGDFLETAPRNILLPGTFDSSM